MADDPYADEMQTGQSFGRFSRLVSPSDSTDLPVVAKGIVVTAAGNVSVIPVDNADDSPVPFVSVAAGFVVPFQVRRVLSTGTTATVYTVEQ